MKTSLNFPVCLALFLLLSACESSVDELIKFGGRVLLADNTSLQGVQVLYEWPETGGLRVEVTNENGWYEYSYGYSFCDEILRITPMLAGYIFDPESYEFPEVCDGDNIDLDFTAYPLVE